MARERRKEIEDFQKRFKRDALAHISYESAKGLYVRFRSNYDAAAGFYFLVRRSCQDREKNVSDDEIVDDLIRNYRKWMKIIREAEEE